VENAGVLPASGGSLAAVAIRRQPPVAREPLLVWALFLFVAVEVFATYARLPLPELYHVSGTGPTAGLGRAVVFLNYSTALVVLPILPFVAGRLWPIAVVSAVLCCGIFWPGIVDQADLDVKWSNAVPAAGVALALGLTIWRVRQGVAPPVRKRHDRLRLAAALVLLVLSLPWLAAELGLSFGDMDAWWAPLGQARVHHAVHHGHHHGMDGTMLVLAALLLSRALSSVPRRLRKPVAVYLGILVTYGLGNFVNDAWYEQFVKRGWTSVTIPSVILPAPNLAWALIVVVGVGVGLLFLRTAEDGTPTTRRIPAAAGIVPAVAVLALVVIGAIQEPQETAHTPFARSGTGTIVFPMAPKSHFHLYEIGADGRGLRQLTDADASDLAPDADRTGLLAFQSNRDGGPHVFVSDPRVRAVRQATDAGKEGEPAWSADGERIAFVRNGDLYVVHRRGRTARPVADDASWPTWRAGGSTLAYELHLAGSEVVVKTGVHVGITGAVHQRDPAWSPDGRLIAYGCLHGHHWHICLARPDLQLVRVLNTGADAFAPAWSPDSKRIAFIGDRDGNDQLYVMRADGTGIVRLTSGQADKDAPAWRP
jgi:WD40-like Beta Propeller Repeat